MPMAVYFWLAMLIVFVFVEASTVAVVSLWFAVGALAAMLTAWLGGEIWLQVCIFATVSGLLLLALRPLVKRYFTPKLTPTNVDSMIGKVGTVTEEIDNIRAVGRVKLGAMEWSARSSSDEKIPTGTLVKADRIEGVRVFVTPIRAEATLETAAE